MGYRRRIYFTEKQKAEIWDRWQRGESMSSIGRLFDRNSSSIYPLLARGAASPPDVLAIGNEESLNVVAVYREAPIPAPVLTDGDAPAK